MDKNVALAVFFLFSISIADVAHATFRYLAAAPPQNNTTSAQVILHSSHLMLIIF